MTKEELREEWCRMKGFNFIDFETLTEAEEYILFLESKIESQQNKVEEREWVNVKDELPELLETIWLSNGKGWVSLGCRVESDGDWHWAESNGIIYSEGNKIVSECESEDLDVVMWCKLPLLPNI